MNNHPLTPDQRTTVEELLFELVKTWEENQVDPCTARNLADTAEFGKYAWITGPQDSFLEGFRFTATGVSRYVLPLIETGALDASEPAPGTAKVYCVGVEGGDR